MAVDTARGPRRRIQRQATKASLAPKHHSAKIISVSVGRRPRADGRSAPWLAGGIGLVVAALAGWVVAHAGDSVVAIVRTEVIGLSYLVAGVIAWRRRPDNPTGPILVAIAYIAIAAVQIPTRLPMTERVPATLDHADRITIFGCDCANPFGVMPAPELLASIERWTAYLSIAMSLVVLGLVVLRLVQSSPPMRRLLWPVLFGAAVGLLAFAISLSSAMLDAQAPASEALGWVLTVARAAVPIGFMAGLLRMKMGQAAIAGLVVGIQGGRSADALEHSIAQALHDPSVRLGYWSAAFALAVDRDRLAASVHAQAADARLRGQGLPGLEPISQIVVPDLPDTFAALRLGSGPHRSTLRP